MNAYEQKQEARKKRLENAADKFEAKAGAVLNVGREHYSRDWAFVTQPGHIPARAQWIKKQERAFEDIKAAQDLRARAASVGTGGISSDDPAAVVKLREELAKLEALQARMIAANKIVRKFKADIHNGRLALGQAGFTAGRAQKLFEPDFCGRIGFPNYETTNNGANIRRIKERIEIVGKVIERADQDDKEHDCGAYHVIEAFTDNRVRVLFPGKPCAAVRSVLKSNGFHWSPDAGAWQRMYSGAVVQWLTLADGYLRKQLTEAQS